MLHETPHDGLFLPRLACSFCESFKLCFLWLLTLQCLCKAHDRHSIVFFQWDQNLPWNWFVISVLGTWFVFHMAAYPMELSTPISLSRSACTLGVPHLLQSSLHGCTLKSRGLWFSFCTFPTDSWLNLAQDKRKVWAFLLSAPYVFNLNFSITTASVRWLFSRVRCLCLWALAVLLSFLPLRGRHVCLLPIIGCFSAPVCSLKSGHMSANNTFIKIC